MKKILLMILISSCAALHAASWDPAFDITVLYDGTAYSRSIDSSGTLTGPTDADGTTRSIICAGLSADGSGWLCQLEEITPGPDGVASCTSYTVSFDGTVIAP